MTRDGSRAGLLWATIAGVSVAFTVGFPLTSTDIWWHLAAGRWMAQNGQVLRVDPFSADSLGARWIDAHWLFQMLVFELHRLGGVLAIVAAKCVLAGGCAALLALLAGSLLPPRSRPLAILTIAGTFYGARQLVLERPIAVTLLCLGLVLLLLERFRREGALRWLMLLIPIQVLWANVQGLHPVGPAVVLCVAIGELIGARLRRAGLAVGEPPLRRQSVLALALAVPVLLGASLMTPYGLDAFRLSGRLLQRLDPVAAEAYLYDVSENVPTWALGREDAQLASFPWVAALFFLSFLGAGPRSFRPRHLLLGATFFGLAVLANRNVLLFYVVAGPLLAVNLGLGLERLLQRWPRGAGRGLTLALAALPLAGTIGLVWLRQVECRSEPSLRELAPFRVPERSVQRIEELGLSSRRMFNSIRYGGYLAWRLHPRGRPFMDGRLILRSPAALAEHLELADHPESSFERFADRHGIELVVLPAESLERYLPLVSWLYRQPGWRLIYTDGSEALYLREEIARGLGSRGGSAPVRLGSPGVVQGIMRELEERYAAHPAILEQAALHLGRFLSEVGELERAEETLRPRTSSAVRALLARVIYLLHRPDEAAALARAAIASASGTAERSSSYVVLALIAIDAGHHQEALGLIEQALAADPYSRQARQALARIRREASGAP